MLRRRDTVPAAFQYLSKTGEDSRGLQGTGGDNKLETNSLPCPKLTTKVAHRRHFLKTRDAGSNPVRGSCCTPRYYLDNPKHALLVS